MSSPLYSWVFQQISSLSHTPPPLPQAVKSSVRHRHTHLVAGLALVLCALASGPSFAREQLTLPTQPLAFEPDQGQAGGNAEFLARGNGYLLYLRPTEAILALKNTSSGTGRLKPLHMRLLGATPRAKIAGLAPLPGRHNYYVGNNPARWHTNIPTYGKVTATGVYPGIDMVYYGKEGLLEYDFMVAAGADPRLIRLGFGGADKLQVSAKGELLITAGKAQLVQHAPYAYQNIADQQIPVAARYTLHGRTVSLALGDYDHRRPLIIDPALSYSSYLGGSGDDKALAVATDADGNIYVTGSTQSADFPGAADSAKPDNRLISTYPNTDAFVTKIDKAGSVIFSTYLGTDSFVPGTEGDAIAVDKTGKIYVTGAAASSPLSNPFPTKNPYSNCSNGNLDVFVAVLNGQGALDYSSCVGGGSGDKGLGIAVDSSGAAYVVGWTLSNYKTRLFPTTSGALQATNNQPTGLYASFFFKLDPSRAGTAQLVYSTYLGCTLSDTNCGNGPTYATAVAVDSSNIAYVAGWTGASADKLPSGFFSANSNQATLKGTQDAFFYKLDPTVNGIGGLLYASYIGGSDTNTVAGSYIDQASGIAVDTTGNVYISGTTTSNDLFTTPNAIQSSYGGGTTLGDAFVAKFSPGTTPDKYNLSYSSYLGGSGDDTASGIAVDSSTGRVYVSGSTASSDFPVQSNEYIQALRNNNANSIGKDAFVTSLEPSGTGYALHYSTYLGGEVDDQAQGIAVAAGDKAYVVGYTYSYTFPYTAHAAQKINQSNQQPGSIGLDAFVTRIAPIANLSAIIAAQASNDLTTTAPPVGDPLTYSIVVTNLGPDPATGITLALALSAPDDLASTTPLAMPSYDSNICQYDGNGKELFTCTLSDLAVSGHQTIMISGILSTGSDVVATTTVSSNELLDPVSTTYTLTANQALPPPSTIVTGDTTPTTTTSSAGGGGGAVGGPLLLILALASLGRFSRHVSGRNQRTGEKRTVFKA